ncbi:hypothetical protein AXG93_3103s1020 [Marchantia polymorpha subsp. ruderalis]|uniref:Uncharacterized protein n=1 Tax=Marchantia polymorpha subsp. ruderalis TaxID=1480154 RepID=A0A176WJ03_MARPO|nr:hypothetical protein AXG93_3103s1020 [Marchantia polymorpha subsp. ruderalis]
MNAESNRAHEEEDEETARGLCGRLAERKREQRSNGRDDESGNKRGLGQRVGVGHNTGLSASGTPENSSAIMGIPKFGKYRHRILGDLSRSISETEPWVPFESGEEGVPLSSRN